MGLIIRITMIRMRKRTLWLLWLLCSLPDNTGNYSSYMAVDVVVLSQTAFALSARCGAVVFYKSFGALFVF